MNFLFQSHKNKKDGSQAPSLDESLDSGHASATTPLTDPSFESPPNTDKSFGTMDLNGISSTGKIDNNQLDMVSSIPWGEHTT